MPYIPPYTQKILGEGLILRRFNENTDPAELIWHQDLKNRKISIIKSNNWKIQLDNNLPISLVESEIYDIPALLFHRVIKGKGDLVILIDECERNS